MAANSPAPLTYLYNPINLPHLHARAGMQGAGEVVDGAGRQNKCEAL